MVDCNCNECKGFIVKTCCEDMGRYCPVEYQQHDKSFSMELESLEYYAPSITLDDVKFCPFCSKEFTLEVLDG